MVMLFYTGCHYSYLLFKLRHIILSNVFVYAICWNISFLFFTFALVYLCTISIVYWFQIWYRNYRIWFDKWCGQVTAKYFSFKRCTKNYTLIINIFDSSKDRTWSLLMYRLTLYHQANWEVQIAALVIILP